VAALWDGQGRRAVDLERASTGMDPLALVFHVDALSVLFALMGQAWRIRAPLLHRLHGPPHDKSATPILRIDADLHRRLRGTGLQRQPLLLYLCWELVGLCSFSLVGFWVHQPRGGCRRAQSAADAHIAGYGLLAAIPGDLPSHGQRALDRSSVAHAFTGGVFALMLVSLGREIVQFPLHT